MADFESNGMAALGHGVFTQTADVTVAFASEPHTPTSDGVNANGTSPDLFLLDRAPTTAPHGPGLSGGSANNGDMVLSVNNDYPMPPTATTDRTSLATNILALKDGLDLGPLTGIFDGLLDNAYATFGVAPAPTFFKMRAWNVGGSFYEYWVSEGAPSAANPSGQPILAGSLTVIAVKRPKDLVGQGPS